MSHVPYTMRAAVCCLILSAPGSIVKCVSDWVGLGWIGLDSVVFYSIGVSFDRFDWIAAMGVFGIAKTRQD